MATLFTLTCADDRGDEAPLLLRLFAIFFGNNFVIMKPHVYQAAIFFDILGVRVQVGLESFDLVNGYHPIILLWSILGPS